MSRRECHAARERIATYRPPRDAVLSYPDLAAKLTMPPLDYAEPGQWNGFVPPEKCDQQLNRSPRRAALVAIVEEAMARDRERSTT